MVDLQFLGQDERSDAIKEFQRGNLDVLVATDAAAKGLDMPNVKHVINYNMPRDVKLLYLI